MPTNISTVKIAASRESVWAALTDPTLVTQGQFGSDLITDWKPGKPIRFSTEWQGTLFEQWGTVLQFDAPNLLSYSLYAPRPGLDDRPENYFTMIYKLTENEGGTELQIVQKDNRPGAVQEAPQGEENPVLAGLKQFIEGNAETKNANQSA
jgi:uncharacterized protein YndB with AHSA1/START domain